MPLFIPPLVTAIVARMLVQLVGASVTGAALVAYIAGTIGTLIGADLLNLPRVPRGSLVDANAATASDDGWVPMGPDGLPMQRRYISSIGGAGVSTAFPDQHYRPILAVL